MRKREKLACVLDIHSSEKIKSPMEKQVPQMLAAGVSSAPQHCGAQLQGAVNHISSGSKLHTSKTASQQVRL